MSWPSENRNPNEAYVVYDSGNHKYLSFAREFTVTGYLCYATMFPTIAQAEQMIGRSSADKFCANLVIKKVILG